MAVGPASSPSRPPMLCCVGVTCCWSTRPGCWT